MAGLAIAGNADLIEMEHAGEDSRIEAVRVITSGAWRLANLIAELRLFDQKDATGLLLRRRAADLNGCSSKITGNSYQNHENDDEKHKIPVVGHG